MSVGSIGYRMRTELNNAPWGRWQIQGVRFMEKHSGRIILGDDMGMGKTYQAIAYTHLHPEYKKILVIVPATMKYKWQDEFELHANLQSQVVSGRKPYPTDSRIVIINFDILKDWQLQFSKWAPDLTIVDECHRLGNRSAKRTKHAKKVISKSSHVLALSGTPLKNRPKEFFPILNMVDPKEFPSFWKYAFRYCDPKPGWMGRGWNFDGASNLKELHNRVKDIMVRRLKVDHLTELPEKVRSILPVDLSNRKEYVQARDHFMHWLIEHKGKVAAKKALRAECLVQIGQLKQLSAKGKIKEAIQWVKDLDKKVVIFAIHKSIMDELKKAFPGAAVVDGSVSMKNRPKEEKKFQEDPKCRVFLGQMEAAGEGLTLTAADTVLFLELGWNPSQLDQAEDRIYRIGQFSDSVSIFYMFGRNTIDEKIWEMIEDKRQILTQILDGKVVKRKMLGYLISKLERN